MKRGTYDSSGGKGKAQGKSKRPYRYSWSYLVIYNHEYRIVNNVTFQCNQSQISGTMF